MVRETPAGRMQLPVATVTLEVGASVAGSVPRAWMATLDGRRDEARTRLFEAARGAQLEVALHLVLLIGAHQLDPARDADLDAHVASGARLWLLAGAVAWALAAPSNNPFAAWAALSANGLWPIGPVGGHLVISGTRDRRTSVDPRTLAGSRW